MPTDPVRTTLRTVSPSAEEFIRNLLDAGLVPREEIIRAVGDLDAGPAANGDALARHLTAAGVLTAYQAAAVLDRKFEDLRIGNYEVLDRIGAGGMGTVYKARHRRMKRVVAIKVLSHGVARSGTFIQRFQREVEVVARLSHPHIVMAFDADEAEAGHFLVMEFVNGRDLATEVQDRGPLPVREAVDVVVQAAQALEYAHAQGIIHRDIKPANLLRDVSGIVKVADLGLARCNDSLARPGEDGALTRAGAIMGTVDFMPPEQALGSAGVDHHADIYSLGCTLFYLLTGRPPYEGGTLMATLLMHRDAPIPSLGDAGRALPQALDAVFRCMVAKKPDERYRSMTEVIAALQAVPLPAEQEPDARIRSNIQPGRTAPAADTGNAGQRTAHHPPPADLPGPTVDLPPAAPLAGLTVLLVEPSRAQAVIIRNYLRELGVADIHAAGSGRQALDLLRSARPEPGPGRPVAVLSAMHLADMTGVQLAQQMRAEAAPAPLHFVLITSEADRKGVSFSDLAENTVLLHKPFDRERLAQALAPSGAPSPPPPFPAVEERGGGTGNLKVLIVDDSAAARSHMRGVLAGLGFRRCAEAVDGFQAIAALGKESFDLVVTDYNMPNLDGRGLIDFIHHHGANPAVPILVVTTETDPAKLEAVRRLGVSAVCDKSFKPEAVGPLLAEVLGQGQRRGS
jgi:serine/threonine protein kinase/DNA-binding response OmpR family regulator